MAGENVFTRISNSSEKQKLFTDLAAGRLELDAKCPEPTAELFRLRAWDFQNGLLICELKDDQQSFPKAKELILTFFVGGEKYFLQAPFEVNKEKFEIKTNVELFHLQRREDYRVKIPPHYKVSVKIGSHKASLMDLSGGGVRLQFDPQAIPLERDQTFQGIIELPDRPALSFQGLVKHVVKDTLNAKFANAGIQFQNQKPLEKDRVIGIVMDLYKEFFIRHAGRS